MSSSKFNAASRTAALAAKSANLTYKETKIPDNSVDFITSFKSASSAVIKMANVFTVDVFPNFVPILMFIMFHCVQSVSRLDDRSHAKVTLPTYIMYCLTIVYGHILLHDMHVRPSPSNFAQDYFAIPEKKQFADMLLSLPVPTFLEPLLKSLTCTTAPHSGNIVFCPSAAAVTMPTHFGRFFPINMFSIIHDFTAELNSRMTPAVVNACLQSRTVFTIPTTTPAHAQFPCTIANLIGSIRSSTADITHGTAANRAYNSYQSVLRQAFDAAFNPVLSRDYTRRQSLAPLNIIAPRFTSAHSNPYDILFAFSPSNFNELRIVLQSVASVMNGSIPCSSDLAKIIGSNSGKDILIHGYSTYALPTFHAVILAANTRNADVNELTHAPTETRQSPEDTAAALQFLVEPAQNAAAHANAFTAVTATCDTTPAHPVTIHPMTPALNLLSDNDVADPPVRNPAASEFITFEEQRDTAPRLSVLEPIEDDTEIAWKASAFGMIIESFEIDGCVVPQPNPEASLALDNARFTESAIPFPNAVRALTFELTTPHYARRRATERRNAFKAATLLINFAQVSIPRPLRHTIDNLVNNGLPGFTYNNHVNWIARTAQYLGFRLESPAHVNQADRLPVNIAAGSILVWSPYCYVPTVQDFNNPTGRIGNATASVQGYYITNLRSLFGTDPQLIEMQHAFNSMPIS